MKKNNKPEFNWEKVIKDPKVRLAVVRKSHLLFFHIHFQDKIHHPTAEFQKEIFRITEDQKIKLAVIEAFRSSSKTTIMSLSYPIWAILGEQKKKFVLLLAQTQEQARQYLTNIKHELETKELLRADLGPFQEGDDEWRTASIVLPKYGARISIASIEKPVRGLLHYGHRPDLIICDDLEDLNSVKTQESRDKLYKWFMGDIMPLGDKGTKVVVIGTRLHEDSLLMRLRKDIIEGRMEGIVRSYPLIDDADNIAWPGKFPDLNSVEELKKQYGDSPAFYQEFLLKIINKKDQIIHLEWIKYYTVLPSEEDPDFRFTATGVDPAFSENETADFTAMVSAKVYGRGEDLRIYILPNPIK